jgi:agmatine/peptidylarginine deiminase
MLMKRVILILSLLLIVVYTIASYNETLAAAITTPDRVDPVYVVLGTGTSSNAVNAACPINITYESLHGQSVYTKTELNAAGVYGPINITQIGFYVTLAPDLALPNFTIRMKHTTATNVSSWQTVTNMITVYTNSAYMPISGGYDMLNFGTPFVWNGNDNIVIDTGFSAVSQWSRTGTTRYTTVTNGYRYVRADDVDQTSIFTGGATSTNRPNIRLAVQAIQTGPNITVSPVSISSTVYAGETATSSLTINNTGTSALTWSTNATISTWGTVTPTSGTIQAGGNSVLNLTLSSLGLSVSTYTSSLIITSNALNNPSLSIPVSFTVQQSPYPIGPRFVAEWEPAKGAIIRYPLGLPYNLLVALSNNGLLYVVVASSSQTACNTALTSNGVNMTNVRYINATTDTYWTRDYGPWTIFNSDNEMKIVDFTYNRPRPNDDIIPLTVANYIGVGYYSMPLTATGGNVMTDGNGKMMSTNLILEENPTLSEDQINTMVWNYLGVTDYQHYVDPNNTYIDHIDCWGKLLDVDKVLIRSVPTSHAQYSAIEATVADWQSRLSAYGTPFKIYRVNTPNNEPYTNSYIMNKSIYVPIMGNSNDAAALNVYRAAMPGYTVTGYTHTSWESTDALHCRTNTVFDAQMIHAWHVPPTSVQANSMLSINVELTHSNALVAATTYVAYRYSTTGAWQYSVLNNVTGNIWTASVPTPALGQNIYYYILATDTTARTAYMPLCGSSDPFHLIVNQLPPNTAPTIDLPVSFSFNMNGNLQVDFAPFVSDPDNNPMTLTCAGNTNVQVSINNLVVTFTATADWFGSENLTFTVSDGSLTADDNVNVIVDFVNSPPVIALPESFTFDQNNSLVVDFSPYVSDSNNDQLTLSSSGGANVLVQISGLSVTLSGVNSWWGNEQITFTVSDGMAGATAQVNVIINLTHLDSPETTFVGMSPTVSAITWNPVPFALSYEIWVSDYPYGIYTLLIRTNNLHWQDTNTDLMRRFYKIIASDQPLAK